MAVAADVAALREALTVASVTEPPPELCCPITLAPFRDPVLVPATGHSYERSALLEHLHKVGAFDPLTRAPVSAASLVRNVALRAAAAAWLDAHPAAWGDLAGPDEEV